MFRRNVTAVFGLVVVLAALQQGSASRGLVLRGRGLTACEVTAVSYASAHSGVEHAVGSAVASAYNDVHGCGDVYSKVQAKQSTIAEAVARAVAGTKASVAGSCTGNSYASASASASSVAKASAFAAAEAIAEASNYNGAVTSIAKGEDYREAIEEAVAESHSFVQGNGYAENWVFAEAVARAIAEVTATAIAAVYC